MIDETEVVQVLCKLVDDEKERTKQAGERSDYTAGYLGGLGLAISLIQFHATLENVSRETLEAAHDDV